MIRVYSSPASHRHDTGPAHPETMARIDAAIDGAHRAGFSDDDIVRPRGHKQTDRIIAKVHSAEYSRELEQAAEAGHRLFHSLDNPISSGTHTAARAAVSTALTAAEDVWVKNKSESAFVIARPPGHHAEKERAMGFCFFNTLACVAESLREQPGIERIFIFDWDVHHGNGTQHLFEERDDVFYTSVHRFPFYPGTGAAREIGVGPGLGYTRNIPLEQGLGDSTYLRVLEEQIIPLIDEYTPQAILISAGFDAHRRDPLGGMSVSEQGFGAMSARIREAAVRHCGGRVLSLLEGGYDPEGIAASVSEHLTAFAS